MISESNDKLIRKRTFLLKLLFARMIHVLFETIYSITDGQDPFFFDTFLITTEKVKILTARKSAIRSRTMMNIPLESAYN